MRALRDGQVPDVYGNTILHNAKRGQIAWSVRGPDGLAVIGRSEQADVVKGVSSNYACQYCCGISYDSSGLSPGGSVDVGLGETKQFVAYETDKNCYGTLMQPHPVTSGVTWTSTNTAAATINGSGLATGVALGQTGIFAKWTVTTYYSYAFGCASNSYQVTSPSATLNVQCLLPTGEHPIPVGGIRRMSPSIDGIRL